MNERCHKMYCCAFHCPKIDIHVCQFLRCLKMTWRSHVMNVSEGGPHTNLSQEIIGMVLVDLKKMTCLPWFLCFKKMHLADDMRIRFFGIRFNTLMSCEHSINSFPKRGSKRGRSVLHDFTLRSFIPFKTS